AALAENAGLKLDSEAKDSSPTTILATANVACSKCGHELMAEEQFCGECGTPRTGDSATQSLQSKLASAWNMQQAADKEIPLATPVNGNGAHPDIPLELEPADLAKLQAAAMEAIKPEQDLPITFDPELEAQIKKMVETLAAEGEAASEEKEKIDPIAE